MTFSLGNHLSYCLIDDRPIFLDLKNDRYFRLNTPHETAFLAYISHGETSDEALSRLVALGVLIRTPDRSGHPAPTRIEPPELSAIECAAAAPAVGLRTMLDVTGIVSTTWLQLRRRPLQEVLASMSACRQQHVMAGQSHDALPDRLDDRLCQAAGAFRRMRLYIPIGTCCLPDSIGMVRFLANQGLHANLVFGIMANPLSAHCWVQARHIVLNDTVGNARAHTPILVV